MLTDIIKLDNDRYYVEYFKYYELPDNNKSYIMLRNNIIDNGKLFDTDIYIIDEDIIKEDKIDALFPVYNQLEVFSQNIEDLIVNNDYKVYNFYDKTGEPKKIKTDIIKIYHPLSSTINNNTIVYVSTTFNNINYHLYCNYYNKNSKSDKEIIINNETYSEYIEVEIPAIEDIISMDTYYIEDKQLCEVNGIKFDNLIYYKDNNTYCATYLLTMPFRIDKEYKKIFDVHYNITIENNFITYPIKVSLFRIIQDTDKLLLTSTENKNTIVFTTAPKITINLSTIFNSDGKLVSKMGFEYPNKNKFKDNNEAYQYYNAVNFEDYEYFYYDTYDENIDDAPDNKQYQLMYLFEVALDNEFKNVIYKSPTKWKDDINSPIQNNVIDIEFDLPEIDINNNLYPSILFCRALFIDKYLGTIIKTNTLTLTADKIKYLIKNDIPTTHKLKLNNMDNIYRINCIVKKEEVVMAQPITNTIIKPLYTPVFYKVYDLQNIFLKSDIIQNIGIDLDNYMSKVQSFNIHIDGETFIEHARNGIYVIFRIPGKKIKSKSGTYHITDQDDNYISSGNWTIEN